MDRVRSRLTSPFMGRNSLLEYAMNTLTLPRFNTVPGIVRRLTAEGVEVALEKGIWRAPAGGGAWSPGQKVEVLLQARQALAVRSVR
jgi:hypothetical protein